MQSKIKLYQYIFRAVAVSLCFVATLVSITQSFGNVSAVESSASANASVTVSSACSFSKTSGSGEYTGTLANNSSVEIIGSTFTTFCNDPGGYAIYAIGYSNNEYGNTDLIYNNESTSTYNIKTYGDTSGNSSWKMKLMPVQNNFTPTIENGYSNYNNIPATYTKVASYNNVTINDTDSTTGSSITTNYQATASSTQPAGTYTGAAKYTMVHPGATPAAYFMQDVADWKTELPNPGDTFQAVDRRDGKVYWVARLADGNIWMTQNLDLDIDETKTYTHYGTDLGYTTNDPTATWQPTEGHSTIDFMGNIIDGWVSSKTEPYSANPGNIYYYASNSSTNDIKYNSLQDCKAAGHTDCEHYHAGNYYNFSAAIASNDSGSISGEAPNSICPSGWRLPSNNENVFKTLMTDYNITESMDSTTYADGGFKKVRTTPLFFNLSGYISHIDNRLGFSSSWGNYHTSTSINATQSYNLFLQGTSIHPACNYYFGRGSGISIRCLARTED